MKPCSRTLMTALLAAACSTACTTQEAYGTGQAWQKQQCLKLPDLSERQRCERSTAMSYEKYKAEAEALKSKPAP